jgi:glycosyltransferase involved in cell wall biosynthesis
MIAEAHIIAWNEGETIALTIKHYQQFCARVVIYDNHSTDNTRQIALDLGCRVKSFGTKGILSDKDYLELKNNCWKGSRADWVIVADADEILWHPKLTDTLDRSTGNIFYTYGWNVFSYDMPKESFLEIQTGFYDANYSKSVVFKPKEISEINFRYGCHTSSPKGQLRYTTDVLTLFHYRNIGGPGRLVNRHALYRERLSEHNKLLGLGCHYLYSDEQRVKEWNEHYKNCIEYSHAGILC